MSKFFDDTRKAENWTANDLGKKSLDVDRILAEVRKPEATMRDLSDSRLSQCRKLILPHRANAPIISGSESSVAALEAYRGLRTRLMRITAKNGVRSVMVSSASPGEGKTLTTINLALCCAQLQDFRVLVIDADLRTRGLTRLLGSPADPGLTEILSGKSDYAEAILATNQPNLYVLAAGGPSVSPPELFAGERWKEFLGWCAETYRLVLVDSPPFLPLADTELILAGCDGALAVVKAMKTSRDLLSKVMAQVDARKVLGAVFNGTDVSSRNGNYQRYYQEPIRPAG